MNEHITLHNNLVLNNEVKVIERALRNYYMNYYKQFIFDRESLEFTENEDGVTYKIDVNSRLKALYGEFKVTVDKRGVITDVEPKNHLKSLHMGRFEVYKGMYVSDEKDKFKVDLLGAL